MGFGIMALRHNMLFDGATPLPGRSANGEEGILWCMAVGRPPPDRLRWQFDPDLPRPLAFTLAPGEARLVEPYLVGGEQGAAARARRGHAVAASRRADGFALVPEELMADGARAGQRPTPTGMISPMAVLNFTPPERLVDERNRPYFLWDSEMTLDEFRNALRNGDRDLRAYLLGKLLRQAKPDDVFQFVEIEQIRDLWPELERYLGRSRPFWTWLLDSWEAA